MALGEDQRDGRQHHAESVGQLGGGRDAVGGVVVPELAFGPHDPLGDGRFGDHEGAGDLCRLEAAEQTERERDLRVGRQRGMATEEHQSQLVVGDHIGELVEVVLVRVRVRLLPGEASLLMSIPARRWAAM